MMVFSFTAVLFISNCPVLSASDISPMLIITDSEVCFFENCHHDSYIVILKQQPTSDDSLIKIAITDALTHFNGSSAFALSFASSFFFPPAGLAIATVNSFTTPKEYNLCIPMNKKHFILNDDYYNAYVKKAKAKKAWLSWAGFLTGTAFCITGLTMTGFIWELPFLKQ